MAQFKSYTDERTGADVRALVAGDARDQVVYQTHPMWTPSLEYFLFLSDRGSGQGPAQPHALCMKTGRVKRLVSRNVDAFTLARKHPRFYFVSGRDLFAVNVNLVFRNVADDRKIGTLPPVALRIEGGLSLDAKEDVLYAGVLLEEGKRWGIFALCPATGTWRPVVNTDFRIGHVQANPAISGIIMFCHETGGDAPQRIWVVNQDGSKLRPFYKETYNEWVTHEVWWGGVRAAFTIWPYDDEHKKMPHGVVSADLGTGKPKVHSQFLAWHVHGSPDSRYLVADDFDRNLWLIRADSGERRLLTQGHLAAGFDTHPHPSFTPDSRAVVFTSSRSGTEDVLLARLPEWDSLPPE